MANVNGILKDLSNKYEGMVGFEVLNIALLGVISTTLDELVGMDEFKVKVEKLLKEGLEEVQNKEFEEISSN